MNPSRFKSTILGIVLATLAGSVAQAQPAPITVFAAASLSESITEVGALFSKETKIPVRFSFAGSSALARQIEQGAPADVFVSADREWMNFLNERRLVDAGSRKDILGNQLALIAPASSAQAPIEITAENLRGRLVSVRVATGEVGSVPVGRYARAALTALGVWDVVSPQLVQTDNVRAALALVARGEVAFGIVYTTDALEEKNVRTVGIFPASSHPEIVYPAALVAKKEAGDAAKFLDYLTSPQARAVFARYGFSVPDQK